MVGRHTRGRRAMRIEAILFVIMGLGFRGLGFRILLNFWGFRVLELRLSACRV